MIPKLTRSAVVGFHGTNGSFGSAGGPITMPGGYALKYPYGRVLDSAGTILLDSRRDSSGKFVGGVAPTRRMPKTLANVLAYAAGTDVELR